MQRVLSSLLFVVLLFIVNPAFADKYNVQVKICPVEQADYVVRIFSLGNGGEGTYQHHLNQTYSGVSVIVWIAPIYNEIKVVCGSEYVHIYSSGIAEIHTFNSIPDLEI